MCRLGIPSPFYLWVAHRLSWRGHNLLYRGQPDDLFIVSYPKSGTTLMQMLVHQLLTDGHIRFAHISEFCPHLERDLFPMLMRRRETIDALPRPHVLKSHLEYSTIPKGPGRYIYVMRNGLDVVVSLYYQDRRGGMEMSFEDYFRRWISGPTSSGRWFEHVRNWLTNKAKLNVLYITYEELRRDFIGTAQRVAQFCDAKPSSDDWPRIAHNCSFDAMRAIEPQVDGVRVRVCEPLGPEDTHCVRRGRAGGWRSVANRSILERYETECAKKLGAVQLVKSLRIAQALKSANVG
jgi:hypothetical protein